VSCPAEFERIPQDESPGGDVMCHVSCSKVLSGALKRVQLRFHFSRFLTLFLGFKVFSVSVS
jgi:hypothetical protein